MADVIDRGHGARQVERLVESGGGGGRQADVSSSDRQRRQQRQRFQAGQGGRQTVHAGRQRIADEEHIKGAFFGLLGDPGEPVNVRRRAAGPFGTPAADVMAQSLNKQAET
ncbi:hypothetical protein D3C80_964000 [compost metagenome]